MKKVTIELSDLDLKCLEHEIVDVREWMKHTALVRSKQISDQLIQRAIRAAVANPDVKTVEADSNIILGSTFSAEGYQNAVTRQKAIEKARAGLKKKRLESRAIEGLDNIIEAAREPS